VTAEWECKDERGNPAKSRFELVASGTAVMETIKPADTEEEMVTLYSLDLDSIALVDYCPTKNQPGMRAVPEAGPIKQLIFSFVSAGNLPDVSVGHEHKLVIQFEDKDRITERWPC
jgi:hypothetical protein